MIPLYCEDGKAYVWNHNDWFELRTKHRVCGVLIGSIPSYPRQNDFLGFPMALLPEEAAMLSEAGICELLEPTNLTTPPSESFRKAAETAQEKLFEDQTDSLRKNKISQLSEKIDLIVAGKRKKLLAKGESITEEALGREMLLQKEIDKLPPIAKAYYLVQLPTQHPWPLECKKLSVKDLSGLDAVRYAVYKNLHERGLYITPGSKFGADYLVYPGEPIKFHASYIVRCVSSETDPLRPTELVAFGRLAVAVNKRGLLATLSESKDVVYQTVQWHDSLVD